MSEPHTIRVVIDPIEIPRPCFHCVGTGYFEDVTVDGNGHDVENEWRCGACDGTGQES